MYHDVKFAQKVDCFEIFPPAVLVRQPLVMLARIVKVQHGSDRIHAQAVKMELRKPIMRTRQQKTFYLVATIIEDMRTPVLMETQTGVFMFIKRGTIKVGQCKRVLREMCGNPVEQHTDTGLMATVNEIAQVVGGAETTAGGEVTGGLITPGFVERVLRNGHQFNVCVTHVLDVGN